MAAKFFGFFGGPGAAPAAIADDDDDEVQWLSVDPRNNQMVPYDVVSAAALEAAYQANRPEVVLRLGGAQFTVKMSDMRQYNTSGGFRKVIRKSNKAVPLERPAVEITDELVAGALSTIEAADAAVAALEKDESKKATKITAADFGSPEPVVRVFDAILSAMSQARYREKYGFSEGSDAGLMRIGFGDPVPSYFANVSGGQSIYNRKLLSLLGLRNLVKFGPEVFLELKEKLFSGSLGDYKPKTGLHKMRYFTGNTVDLDTCVLRCHEKVTLDAINTMQRKQNGPTFRNAEELANSEVGKRMAIEQAKMMIDAFAERFKLTADQIRKRRIDLDPEDTDFPVATTNDDRGKCPLWIYRNAGVLTFHANVPTMSDVYGALLLAPYHLAKAFILVHRQSKTPEDLVRNLDAFFEDGVSDSCFNAKWKSIEMFVQAREESGFINDVLNRLQQDNQAKFLALDDDDDGQKELALMLQLAKGATGIDPRNKKRRPIAQADVRQWHAAIMKAAG
eukprot:CAMPEP_0174851410 /NCGR_PEP_ID=MMETSP1114-20130205/23176_1 /TAXON_ID=312471 /ORGANISM="Neobodo designis, Strain CCAP 1951/1" /LENGTH=506 /DNA_ID=CAMNT_0016085945 /DNA_START=32 /DNA_END=1549 /DNA_ORIENTATION=-